MDNLEIGSDKKGEEKEEVDIFKLAMEIAKKDGWSVEDVYKGCNEYAEILGEGGMVELRQNMLTIRAGLVERGVTNFGTVDRKQSEIKRIYRKITKIMPGMSR